MTEEFEGDIKLSPNVEALVAEGVRKKGKAAQGRGAVNRVYLWKYGIVPYEIDSVFGEF